MFFHSTQQEFQLLVLDRNVLRVAVVHTGDMWATNRPMITTPPGLLLTGSTFCGVMEPWEQGSWKLSLAVVCGPSGTLFQTQMASMCHFICEAVTWCDVRPIWQWRTTHMTSVTRTVSSCQTGCLSFHQLLQWWWCIASQCESYVSRVTVTDLCQLRHWGGSSQSL